MSEAIEARVVHGTLSTAFLEAAEVTRIRGVGFWNNKAEIDWFPYAQLVEEALLIAGALQQRGLRKGDRVAIVLPTDPDFYRAFFGVILAGGVPSALYPPVRLGRIQEWKQRTAYMMQALSCKAVLTDNRLFGLLGNPVKVAAPDFGCATVKSLLKEGVRGKIVDTSRDDLAFVQFSSGSTGTPKPVALTHANVLGNAGTILREFPGDIYDHSGVSWLPLYHDMGLVGCLVVAMVVPGDLTLIRPEQFVARPRMWLEALTKTKATISVAPNFAFGLCVDRIREEELAGLDLSHWKVALCGAETVHPHTLDKFASYFTGAGFRAESLTPVYGLAEATLAVTFSPLDKPPVATEFDRAKLENEDLAIATDQGLRLVSVGPPLPGVELEIRDEDDQPLSPGRVGRVFIRGIGVMQGYLDLPEESAAILDNRWLDTEDRGFLHEGNLYLCGRYKDVIIIRGRNCDPSPIEHTLEGLEGVRTGCVAAFGASKNAGDTEELILLVECREDAMFQGEEQLQREIRARVRAGCQLDVAEIVLLAPGTLPRTSSGKIRRREAKRLWREMKLSAPGRGGVATVMRHTLSGLFDHHRAAIRRKKAE